MVIHTELMALMKEEYTALKAFFDAETPKKKRGPHAAAAAATVPEVPQVPEVTQEEELERPPPKLLANTKIRIIKKAASPEPVEGSLGSLAPKGASQASEQKRMDSKELKAWQKEQEAKKLAELTAAGTNPETLLTPESIKRWIEDEGRTFAYVAREYVGLPEATVADFAKSHGVKSKISKSRAILSAKNRRP